MRVHNSFINLLFSLFVSSNLLHVPSILPHPPVLKKINCKQHVFPLKKPHTIEPDNMVNDGWIFKEFHSYSLIIRYCYFFFYLLLNFGVYSVDRSKEFMTLLVRSAFQKKKNLQWFGPPEIPTPCSWLSLPKQAASWGEFLYHLPSKAIFQSHLSNVLEKKNGN